MDPVSIVGGALAGEAFKRSPIGERMMGILDYIGLAPQEKPAPVEDRNPPVMTQARPDTANRNPMIPIDQAPVSPDPMNQGINQDMAGFAQSQSDLPIVQQKIGQRAQQLMQEVPEEKRNTKEAQDGAFALSVAENAQVAANAQDQEGIQSTLKKAFGNEEMWLTLALGFNSMRMRPDAGLAGVIGKRLEVIQANKLQNQTISKLAASGNKIYQKVAEYMKMGMKFKDALEAAKNGGINAEDEQSLRKELTATEAAKNVAQVSIAFDRIKAVADQPSAAGDLALIFNFMKMLDPGSVVRESEFATAQNAAGVPDRIRNIYNNLLKGERLAPDQRGDFISQAGRLYNSAVSQYQPEYERYTGLAKAYGYDPSRIARQYDPFEMPSKPEQAPVGTSVGTVKTFITADGTVAKYRKITDGPDTDSTTWQKVD